MLDFLDNFYIKHFKFICFFGFVLLLAYAWSNRFIQDDAFISFRYAENLAHGNGLVFNPGERVEGYTNFLWTLLASLILDLNLPLVYTIYLLGLAIYALSLVFLFRLGILIFKNRYKAFIPVIIAGINFSFSAYATGGLETQLQALLFIISFYLYYLIIQDKFSFGKALVIGIVFSLALFNRLDSAIMVVVLGVSFMIAMYQKSTPLRKAILFIVSTALPVVITLSIWFFWKLNYYGDILPNTFYAKATSGGFFNPFLHGIFYVCLFVFIYSLPLIFLFFSGLLQKIIKHSKGFSPLMYPQIALILIFLAYIIKVGGDFMEFRFLVPLIPFFAILIYYVSTTFFSPKQQVFLLLLIFLSSFLHKYIFNPYWNGYGGIESIAMLQDHIDGEDDNWEHIGIVLKENFQHSGAVIGVSPAGVIPYYSKLYTIDLLGLNDQWIARNGTDYKNIPGHKKIATLDYLIERKVNFVIGHPLVINETHIPKVRSQYSKDFLSIIFPGLQNKQLHNKTYILEIPLANHRHLVLWYLSPTPALDKIINKNQWRIFQI